MYSLLAQLNITTSSRKELDGGGICLGVTNTPAPNAKGVISKVTWDSYALVREIMWVLRSVPGWPEDFPTTSLQVNSGSTAVHADKPNIGMSCTLSVGSFSGGELWLEGDLIDTFTKPTIFNGKRLHATMPFVGNRLVVVAFSHGLAYQLDDGDFSCLHDLGFLPMRREQIRSLDSLLFSNGGAADI